MTSLPCQPPLKATNYAPIQWGRVRWYDYHKKFGFIEPLDGLSEDVFVHFNDLMTRKGRPGQLYTGEYVEYRILDSEKDRPRATGVTGIGGGPLLCESGKLTFESYTREEMLEKKDDVSTDAPPML